MKTIILSGILMLMSINLLALNPSRTYKQLPDKYNMKYESASVRTADGKATLASWYFPAREKTTRFILISHNGEGNMGDHLRVVENFITLGYNVITYDYRGYGESSEFEIDNNMYIYPHFQDDFRAMLSYCSKRFAPTFFVYGWGIGAGISMGVGFHRKEVKGIIADTPFLSMEDLESRFSSSENPMEIPFAGYDKRTQPLYALDGNESRSLKGILIIVGSNDPLFSDQDMERLRAKRDLLIKPIFVIENPDNKANFLADSEAYWKRIGQFIRAK